MTSSTNGELQVYWSGDGTVVQVNAIHVFYKLALDEIYDVIITLDDENRTTLATWLARLKQDGLSIVYYDGTNYYVKWSGRVVQIESGSNSIQLNCRGELVKGKERFIDKNYAKCTAKVSVISEGAGSTVLTLTGIRNSIGQPVLLADATVGAEAGDGACITDLTLPTLQTTVTPTSAGVAYFLTKGGTPAAGVVTEVPATDGYLKTKVVDEDQFHQFYYSHGCLSYEDVKDLYMVYVDYSFDCNSLGVPLEVNQVTFKAKYPKPIEYWYWIHAPQIHIYNWDTEEWDICGVHDQSNPAVNSSGDYKVTGNPKSYINPDTYIVKVRITAGLSRLWFLTQVWHDVYVDYLAILVKYHATNKFLTASELPITNVNSADSQITVTGLFATTYNGAVGDGVVICEDANDAISDLANDFASYMKFDLEPVTGYLDKNIKSAKDLDLLLSILHDFGLHTWIERDNAGTSILKAKSRKHFTNNYVTLTNANLKPVEPILKYMDDVFSIIKVYGGVPRFDITQKNIEAIASTTGALGLLPKYDTTILAEATAKRIATNWLAWYCTPSIDLQMELVEGPVTMKLQPGERVIVNFDNISFPNTPAAEYEEDFEDQTTDQFPASADGYTWADEDTGNGETVVKDISGNHKLRQVAPLAVGDFACCTATITAGLTNPDIEFVVQLLSSGDHYLLEDGLIEIKDASNTIVTITFCSDGKIYSNLGSDPKGHEIGTYVKDGTYAFKIQFFSNSASSGFYRVFLNDEIVLERGELNAQFTTLTKITFSLYPHEDATYGWYIDNLVSQDTCVNPEFIHWIQVSQTVNEPIVIKAKIGRAGIKLV